MFANQIRRRLPRAGDKRHLDEVVVKIGGVKHWLWGRWIRPGRCSTSSSNPAGMRKAAKRLMRKLLKKQCRPPRVLITDKLASYSAAKAEVMPSVEHRRHKGLNNRAENSHQPTRRRERQMKRFEISRPGTTFPRCEWARGPDADRRRKSLNQLVSTGPQGDAALQPGPRAYWRGASSRRCWPAATAAATKFLDSA